MNQLNNNNVSNDAPQLCNSCFEFFGNKQYENLCSGCYKKKCKEQTQLKTLTTATVPADNAEAKTEANTPTVGNKNPLAEESPVTQEVKPVEAVKEEAKPVEKPTNKCNKCSKKVSVLGFACKCGATFCKAHRLPEDHDCDYDFKQAGKAKLTKDLEAVVASKVQKI